MKLPRVAQLARALARSTPSAGADRYEPEVASKLDPVDGMHTATGEGEQGSSPAPGTEVQDASPRSRPWITWHQELGDPRCPYLIRWLIDLRLFSIRLHHWVRSDDKRAMHDHSWWFLTFVLAGGYTDWIYDVSLASESDRERICAANESLARVIRSRSAKDFSWPYDETRIITRSAKDAVPCVNAQAMPYTEDRLTRGSVRFRPAHHIHTVAVDPGGCWTLILTGRFAHKYGFYVRKASGLLKFRKANKYFNQHGHHPCDQP